MKPITRRHFLETSLAGAGALLTVPSWAAEAQTRSIADTVPLGKTGITLSRMGMGTGMHGGGRQSDHTRLGQEKFTALIRHGFERGLTLFDMADLYGSHPFVKNALAGVDRDKYSLMTKLWFRKDRTIQPSGGAKAEVERFLTELGTDRIDIVLIHCVVDADWIEKMKRVRDELSELKEKGIVRAVGCSYHNLDALKAGVQDPWSDVVFARINHAGNKMDGTPEEVASVLKEAKAKGKGVVGMKIFGEGTLIKPEEKDASMKFVWSNNLVDTMSVGMLSTAEVDDSMDRANKALRA